jgi:serine/threonine protein kinase
MPKEMNGKTRSIQKIQNEIDILARMDHDNVAQLYKAFENDTNVFMVMEL